MRLFARLVLVAALLLALPASAARNAAALFDSTSAVGGSVDSKTLITSQCSSLLVVVSAGTATTGAVTVYAVDETPGATCPSTACLQVGTVATVATTAPDKTLSMGLGTTAGAVPKRTRIIAAAGGGGTVRLRVECGIGS
jgi:hypothetical protein